MPRVVWRPAVTAAAACALAGSLALAAWAHSRGEARAVLLAGLLLAGLLAALAAMLRFRLTWDESGLVWRSLLRTRRLSWDEVVGVRYIEQWDDGSLIWRRPTTSAAAAFHVLIQTRHGRIDLNRWMSGLAELLAALRQRGLLDQLLPAPLPTRHARFVDQASRVVATTSDLVVGGLGVFLFVLVVSLGVASKLPMTGNFLLDALLVAAGVTLLVAAVVLAARRYRRLRLGLGLAAGELEWRARDLLFGVASALGGGLLMYGFVPRALAAARENVDLGLVVMGLLLLYLAARDLWRYARGR